MRPDLAEKPSGAVEAEPSTAQPGVRRRRTGRRPLRVEQLSRVSMVLLMVLLAVPFVFPTWWMITSSLKSTSEILRIPPTLWPASPSVQPYQQVFELQPFAQQYFNSVYIAVLVTLGTIAVASLAGYAFARIQFPGANELFVVVLSGLLVPADAVVGIVLGAALPAGVRAAAVRPAVLHQRVHRCAGDARHDRRGLTGRVRIRPDPVPRRDRAVRGGAHRVAGALRGDDRAAV